MAYQGSITLVDLSDGQSGSSGINTATIYLYKRAATVPNKPNGTLRYTFSTHTLSGDYFNEWESSIDNLSGNNPIWIIAATATASVDIDYDDILYTEWSNPIKMAENGQDGQPGQPGQPGQDGTPGINTATVYIYQRASSTPSTPANTSYTFATGSFVVPTNWYKEIPTTDGNPCYIASAVAISTEATATLEWSTPVILVEDGTDGQPGLPGEPGAQGASVAIERELYYLKTNSTSVPQITEISQITSTDRQNGWTSISPTYVSGGSYYTCIETTLNNDGVTELIWSEPVLNQGLTVANANASLAISQADAVNTQLGGHFIYKGVQVSQTPAGAGVIQLTKNQQDQDVTGDPNQWGYNTWIGSNGIKLRLNQIDLSFWSNTGLTFYNPNFNNPNNKGIELNINGLSLYKPLASGEQNQLTAAQLTADGLNFYGTSVSTPDVTLNADGLTLINGSIRGGIVGQDEFLYLSPQVFADEYEEYILSEDTEVDETKTYYIRSGGEGEYIYTEISEPTGNPQENEYYEIAHAPGTIPIDNYVKDNWRQIIGRKFAVDTDGNLYANGLYANNAELKQANVEGNITATSLMIGSGNTAYDGEAAINITGYTIEIIEDPTDIHVVEANTTYLYPVMYHNGIQVGNSELTLTDYIWYKDDITPGEHGDSVKGGIIASYGHRYKVTYDFADGEVGGGIPVRSVTVDPSKYITQISDTGITIHPEAWENNQSSSINLTASGLDILDRYGNSIAQYGSTARIGLNNSSRFLMNSNSLEAYDSNNNKYFEVNSNGLSWGNNTAATTNDLVNAAKTATNYISVIDNGGIKVHEYGSQDTDYAQINSNGMSIFKDGNNIAEFGSIVRVGIDDNNYSRIIIDPSYFSSGISNIYSIMASTPQINYSVQAQRVVLNDNNISDGVEIITPFPEYGSGSRGYKLYIQTFDDEYAGIPDSHFYTKDIIINELASLRNTKKFKIKIFIRAKENNDHSDPPSVDMQTKEIEFELEKGTRVLLGAITTHNVFFSNRAAVDVDIAYDGNYTITIRTNGIYYSSYYWYDADVVVTQLSYNEDGILVPIHQLNGDVYACLSQDLITGDYTSLGNFYIGLDLDSDADRDTPAQSGKDKDLFNIIQNLNWYDDVIIQ